MSEPRTDVLTLNPAPAPAARPTWPRGLGRCAWAAAVMVLLSACVSEGAIQPGGDPSRAAGASRDLPSVAAPPPTRESATGPADLVTASDESEASKRSRIRLELAAAYFAQGQTATALDEVKRALVADPFNVAAYNLRGLIYASLGEQGLAEDSFRRALVLQPGNGDTLHNRGWFLCSLKRYAEARTDFAAALASPTYSERAKTLMLQGICEARSGDVEAAEHSLARSFELDASNPATAMNLAELLLRRGELERAAFYIQRVNAVPDQVNAQTLWLAARIEKKRGNTASVAQLGEQLRSRFPSAPQTVAFDQGKFND